MKTLFILAQAIRNGLTNNEISFLPSCSAVSFKTYIGNLSATGKHSIDDEIPAGLFIWGEENFISIPCTVFTDYKSGQKIAFYSL